MTADSLFATLPTDGIWTGTGVVRFAAPDGELRGPTTIRVSSAGDVSVEMRVTDADVPKEYGELPIFLLMLFVDGDMPVKENGRTVFKHQAREHEITLLQVQVEGGIFRGTRGFVSNASYGDETLLSFTIGDLVYARSTSTRAAYWLLPLLGDFKGCLGGCSFLCHPIALPGEGVPFVFKGNFCGLQAVPDRKADDPERLVQYGAIAFGEVAGSSPHIDEILGCIPAEIVHLLRFGTGTDVEVPWLELRDADGELVRRIHSSFGSRNIRSGSGAFSRFDRSRASSGLGEFLRCFFALPEDRRVRLIAPMNLISTGSPGNATIEECIADLVQALDALCRSNKIGRVDLLSTLELGNADVVRKTTSDAKQQLLRLRLENANLGKTGEVALLDKIISRQVNIATSEDDFGISVSELLRRLRLFDGDVMNAYYSSKSGPTWEGLLSQIRGGVIHSGGIHIAKRTDLRAWFAFVRHLHDICKRAILREVGYTGTYAATNARYTGTYEVGRITPKTTIEELGYATPIPAI